MLRSVCLAPSGRVPTLPGVTLAAAFNADFHDALTTQVPLSAESSQLSGFRQESSLQ